MNNEFKNTLREQVDNFIRYKIIKSMNYIMMNMNNEDAYYTWTTYVPDEATQDDFHMIADSESSFKECTELFFKLTDEYGRDGISV